MSNLLNHAIREFKALGYTPPDEDQDDGPDLWIQQNVLELIKVFSEQGHSGSSAPYCVRMFAKLAMFEPLSPLTGEDWEWVEVAKDIFQNVRASRVFKDGKDGPAYNIYGRIFRDPDGSCWTNSESRVFVTFPYTPTSVYVDRA
jgi:hypothetical protein